MSPGSEPGWLPHVMQLCETLPHQHLLVVTMLTNCLEAVHMANAATQALYRHQYGIGTWALLVCARALAMAMYATIRHSFTAPLLLLDGALKM